MEASQAGLKEGFTLYVVADQERNEAWEKAPLRTEAGLQLFYCASDVQAAQPPADPLPAGVQVYSPESHGPVVAGEAATPTADGSPAEAQGAGEQPTTPPPAGTTEPATAPDAASSSPAEQPTPGAQGGQPPAEGTGETVTESATAPGIATNEQPDPDHAPAAVETEKAIVGDSGLGEQQPQGGLASQDVPLVNATAPQAQSGVPLPEDRAAGVRADPANKGMVTPGSAPGDPSAE